ncbi:hypothetical protein M8818_005241 [Zalaria obscura]|uniref:Uncharacterized protein n=1 Tax=Zalaria obscura TaxID=2024903 RepID=A0ACC3SA64_9PEZI
MPRDVWLVRSVYVNPKTNDISYLGDDVIGMAGVSTTAASVLQLQPGAPSQIDQHPAACLGNHSGTQDRLTPISSPLPSSRPPA